MIDFSGRCRGILSRWFSFKKDLEREASERYKGFVVRSRLKWVPNVAVKYNSYVRKEEGWSSPHRYIEFILFPDEHMLWSSREIREAFRVNIHDHFSHLLDLTLQRFCSYHVDFVRLHEGKRLAAKGWLKSTNFVMCWSRSASTSRQEWMVCLTKCTWGCRICLCLFWRMCSTIGLRREPALPMEWSHWWRKEISIFRRN